MGVAIGDALGVPLETPSPKDIAVYFRALKTLGESFGLREFLDPFEYKKRRRVWLPAGLVSDDTELTYAFGKSLVECGFDPADQYRRYRELVHGLATSPLTGLPMYGAPNHGAGSLTRAVTAFETFEESSVAKGLPVRPSNGSLMRTAPIALRYTNHDPEALIEYARAASRVTHRDPLAGDCCALYVLVLGYLMCGHDPAHAISLAWGDLRLYPISPWLRTTRELEKNQLLDNPGFMSGSAMRSLMIALWAIQTAPDFETGITEVIKLGGDTDTNAAIAGGLLGARFGIEGIPERWLNGLYLGVREKMEQLARDLYAASKGGE